jgi:predicted nucleic acid-binding protein
MRYLLDTNVLSELVKPRPAVPVVQWIDSVEEDALFLSVLTLGEIRKGIEKCRDEQRRNGLSHWLEHDVTERFDGRVLPVDLSVAEVWGMLCARMPRTISAVDGLIAATCLAHQATLVTRNVRDFSGIPNLRSLNPWG